MNFSDLIGKTITGAQQMRLDKYDDDGYLKLDFTDGSSCVIEAGYGRYSGDSKGDYPTAIYIEDIECFSKTALSPSPECS